VLLDMSNLFVSKSKKKLIECAEAIKALIFPFRYEMIYVPHLPKDLIDRVETPFIYMLGIEQDVYNENKVFNQAIDGTFIVDLDGGGIQEKPWTSVLLNRQGTVSGKSVGDPPELPVSAAKILSKAVAKAREKLKKRKPHEK
jgi:hypothetical protein